VRREAASDDVWIGGGGGAGMGKWNWNARK